MRFPPPFWFCSWASAVLLVTLAAAEPQIAPVGISIFTTDRPASETLESVGLSPGTHLILAIRRPGLEVQSVAEVDAATFQTVADETGRSLLGPGQAVRLVASMPGEALVELLVPRVPSAQATRVRFTGRFAIRSGGTDTEFRHPAQVLAAGTTLNFGSGTDLLTAKVLAAGRSPTVAGAATTWEAALTWSGPVHALGRLAVFRDGKEIEAGLIHASGRDLLQLPADPAGPVDLVLTMRTGMETITVPFDITVGVGLAQPLPATPSR